MHECVHTAHHNQNISLVCVAQSTTEIRSCYEQMYI